MKNAIKHALCGISLLGALAGSAYAQKSNSKNMTAETSPTGGFASKIDSASYALGQNIIQSLMGQGLTNLNFDLVSNGLKDGAIGKSQLSPQQVEAALTWLQAESQRVESERKAQQLTLNKVEGEAFLAKNKTQPGVITTASGLQYKVLREGAGESPTAANTVTVHYEGRLISGKVFDSSYQRGQTIEFGVTQVIKGWTEALQLMKPGAKFQLYIPSEIAYGERGAGADIGPNAVLIFDVELISFK